MKVLMFGWEFPPKIYGGLAVASYGITKGLSLQGDMETIFCMPKPSGEEEKFLKIIGMNQVPIVWRDVNYDYLKSRLLEMTPEELAVAYHDFAQFSHECTFRGCLHDSEPNCGVKKAVEDGKISKERYEHYLMNLQDVKKKEERKYG